MGVLDAVLSRVPPRPIQPRPFTPVWRLAEDFEQIGGAAARLGGVITVASREGVGSAVALVLPQAPAAV